MSPQAPTSAATTDKPTEFQQSLQYYINAGYGALYIPSSEEHRVSVELSDLCLRNSWQFVTWDCVQGFTGQVPEGVQKEAQKWRVPLLALLEIGQARPCFSNTNNADAGPIVIVMRNLSAHWSIPEVRRHFKTLCEDGLLNRQKQRQRVIILLSPSLDLHADVQTCVTPIEYALPDEAEMDFWYNFVYTSMNTNRKSNRALITPTAELQARIVQALLGLTAKEAEDLLSRLGAIHAGFPPDVISQILDAKATIIGKSQVLTYIPEKDTPPLDEIGGYDELFSFVTRRALAYTKEARALNLDYPKGVALFGLPGSGKSYVAKGIGRILNLPVNKLDVGAVFDKLVGASEARMRDAIKQIEAQRGCVLILDEADKTLAKSTATGDSGVTQRVMGQLLTWLAEKQSPTFVVVTGNRSQSLSTEFMRAGRFDAIFYVDAPDEQERRQILEIHLKKRGVSLASLGFGPGDWKEILSRTTDYLGAELETVVVDARYRAFEARRQGVPNMEEFMAAINDTIPLAVRDKEGLEEIRKMGEEARPVSSRTKRAKAASGGPRLRTIASSPPTAQ